MSAPLAFSFVQKSPLLPVLEISAMSLLSDSVPEQELLKASVFFIDLAEKFGGVAVQPLEDPPTDRLLFFTVRFKSNEDLKNFGKALGAYRMGL